YGRIVHLQPMSWKEDWPIIGQDCNNDGIGEPVLHYKKPDVGNIYPTEAPASSDDFDAKQLGLQWQWQANPCESWYELGSRDSHVRLYAVPAERSLFDQPNLLLQKLNAPNLLATTKLDGTCLSANDQVGVTIFGSSYAYLALMKDQSNSYLLRLVYGTEEQEIVMYSVEAAATVYVRLEVS